VKGPKYDGGTIPEDIALCPECNAQLEVRDVYEWESETGIPTEGGFYLDCRNEDEFGHRYWQSDWQGEIDSVYRWIVSQSHPRRQP